MAEFLYYDRTTIESWMRDTLDRAQRRADVSVFDRELGNMAYAAYAPKTHHAAANLAALHVLYAGPMQRLQQQMAEQLAYAGGQPVRFAPSQLEAAANDEIDAAQVSQYEPSVIAELVDSFRQCNLGQLKAYQANDEAGQDLQIAAAYFFNGRDRVDQELRMKPDLAMFPAGLAKRPPQMPVQTVQLGMG